MVRTGSTLGRMTLAPSKMRWPVAGRAIWANESPAAAVPRKWRRFIELLFIELLPDGGWLFDARRNHAKAAQAADFIRRITVACQNSGGMLAQFRSREGRRTRRGGKRHGSS